MAGLARRRQNVQQLWRRGVNVQPVMAAYGQASVSAAMLQLYVSGELALSSIVKEARKQ